ncbi:prolyl-tRNA synthetase [Trichoderma citrinoviride]|uniref:proline--tRNA ligase n=1 Tax=Trichoderma citrinoviride TaxID=58853 RepID=A0A2T4B4H2_9HYPO|nr:prolyl-tRNA synthetase [Trichoderma citrinoviride]PTB64101.1 prolyl-tRNA synthetase [Trichoderma citrinoviride]
MRLPASVRHGGFHQLKAVRSSNLIRTYSQPLFAQSIRLRSTLSKIWAPTGGVSATEGETGHGKLIRAGFLRQAQSGVFQLLPLGLRVQDKIERLVDKHMQNLGASKLALSTLTTEELWRKSGRLDKVSPELFRLTDRKGVPIMLSPTHEEEITSLVASTLKSYKDLPIKLYQITRKYRDEIRPRHGLLRSREFIMKDLYTFDLTVESAVETYRDVAAAYSAFFADLNLPILVAEASSGDMGGEHSHEYHLSHAIGEDTVAACSTCGYTANDEVAAARSTRQLEGAVSPSDFGLWRGITKDRMTLVNAWYPRLANGSSSDDSWNIHAVKSVVSGLDTSVSDAWALWKEAVHGPGGKSGELRLLNVIDSRLVTAFENFSDQLPVYPPSLEIEHISQTSVTQTPAGQELNLLRIMDGDGCPRCETGKLEVHRALELGHTFLLGTRYSAPLEATVALPQNPRVQVPVQMGCFGIGVSRILGAVAEQLADDKGLNWPRAIAPFEVVVIPTSGVNEEMLEFYDSLTKGEGAATELDVVLDDRKEAFGWKMQDADMTGYPVVIVLGKPWRERGECEVQCRRLSVKENVQADDVPRYVAALLERL